MTTLADYRYELPPERIAQRPPQKRDDARLLVLKGDLPPIDSQFSQLENFLRPGDLLVLNDTRVIPARLIGRLDNGRVVEFLLLKRQSASDWQVLVRPGRKLLPGKRVTFSSDLTAEILDTGADGLRLVRFFFSGVFEELLEGLGEMPLPPYIHEKLQDRDRYQTVYARYAGSAAAPTAGFHFTPQHLDRLQGLGIQQAYLTLHVGLGTFRPVREENLDRHKMHEEAFVFPEEAALRIAETKARGGRVVAVGTTSLRVLETVAGRSPRGPLLQAQSGTTDLFIRPGFTFFVADALITNFHLPESTLLMLVSAFSGRERILAAYQHAIETGYRFFSFGDAMLLLPEKEKPQ